MFLKDLILPPGEGYQVPLTVSAILWPIQETLQSPGDIFLSSCHFRSLQSKTC